VLNRLNNFFTLTTAYWRFQLTPHNMKSLITKLLNLFYRSSIHMSQLTIFLLNKKITWNSKLPTVASIGLPIQFGNPHTPWQMFLVITKVAGIYDGGRILEVSAHLLSRALSQSAPVACCTLSLSLSLSHPHSARHPPKQVTTTDYGGRVLDGSAHLKSRSLVSQ
jgi:hypothetical protein